MTEKDPSFCLELLEARVYEDFKFTGDSKPLTLYCTSINDGSDISCVVKLKNDLPYKEHSCAREAIGSMVACYFGLRVPTPYIVHISSEFTDSVKDQEINERCKASIGDNFGSKNLESGIFPFDTIPQDKLQDALFIFAFDALIQNADRSKLKSNMFRDPEGFILFDHEKAFPYTKPGGIIGGFPKPYELTDYRFGFLRNHITYNYIQRQQLDFDIVENKIASLKAPILDRMIENLPKSWKTEEIDIIRMNLLEVSINSDRFVRCLKEVLA